MKAKNKKIEIDFSNKKEVGNLGEELVCTFLSKKGFLIVERNYLKKWGEIDIIAIKDNVLTFIEVKSVIDDTHSISPLRSRRGIDGGFRPEENVHIQKRARLRRTIQTYIAQHRYDPYREFLFHVAIVRINRSTRRAHIDLLENIIL